MADYNNLDQKFMDFTFGGLDHGIDSISEGGGPLIPFLMTQTGDKKELKRFVTNEYKEGITAAENALKELSPSPDYSLIAYDGFITMEGKRYDAIFVRVFDKTRDEGFNFCQRYVAKAGGKGIEPVFNSAFIGKEPNFLFNNNNQKKPWWKF